MESYKVSIIIFIFISNVFCTANDIYNEDRLLSMVGNSNVIEGDYKISFGFLAEELPYSYNFFSVNKLISHNMLVSTLFSKYHLDKTKIFIQNSILLKSINNAVSLQLITNYLFSRSNFDKWAILGINCYYNFRNIIFSIGRTYPLIDENKSYITNSLNIERRINRNYSINYTLSCNEYMKCKI